MKSESSGRASQEPWRRMDMAHHAERSVALVLCPLWGTETPPIALAYLAAAMRKHGYAVSVHDFNLEFSENHGASLIPVTESKTWGDPAAYEASIRPLLSPVLANWAVS